MHGCVDAVKRSVWGILIYLERRGLSTSQVQQLLGPRAAAARSACFSGSSSSPLAASAQRTPHRCQAAARERHCMTQHPSVEKHCIHK